eukprot:GDKJ01044259.1.p1 GENE.GDKJ01044259.1~~GDKJ01044259.1.p1  ORF type:complete len:629 (-),score=-0.25 GDKJ01044259.1:645-2531(-)
MELVYLFIPDDGMTIKNQSFNLSSRFIFTPSFFEDDSIHINIRHNPLFIPQFIGDDIGIGYSGGQLLNITGVIGENGVGKSNLIHYLLSLVTDELALGEEFVLGLFDSEKDTIQIYHTLADRTVTFDCHFESPKILDPIKQTFTEYEELGNFFKEPSMIFHGSQAIYYNPLFNTQHIGSRISIEYLKYVDVSTSALITNDLPTHDEGFPDEVDALSLFRSTNTRRQFNMLLDPLLRDIPGLNLPTQIEINFPRSHFYTDKAKQNLTSENNRIFKDLDELIKTAFNKVNGEISRLNQRGERDNEDKKSLETALKEKFKVEFCYALIHNFFYNLNVEYQIDIGIKSDEIIGSDLLTRLESFLNLQRWKDFKGNRVPAYELFRVVIKHIDLTEIPINDNDKNFTVSVEAGEEIIMAYENYLMVIPQKHKRNLMTYGWRNLSSGENAMIDLYSRLHFALHKRLKAPTKGARDLYVFIDEGDSGFHPAWQRDYLMNLIPFIRRLFQGYRWQLFLTSHSPFLVSDLPRENLVLMEKVDGHCKVQAIYQQDDHNQPSSATPTLAANINRLLGEKFFLEGGSIGGFARNIINSELSVLDEDSKIPIDSKRIEKLALMIGERVLSSKIMEALLKNGE